LKEALTVIRAFSNFRPFEREYRFTNLEPMPIQVDGEVMDLGAGAAVRIHIAHQAMRTLL
jgi:diacylglycerol kinase (ATP)